MAKDGAELVGFEFEFEDGMSWLPAHVLHEACGFDDFYFSKEKLRQRAQHNQQNYHNRHAKYIGDPLPHQKGGSSPMRSKPSHRPRYNNNRASGGPGMQAIFLGSSQKSSSGTGVFLPRGAGSDFQPRQKPACSPVLLPSRVVQALNLNVQALGLQISPQKDEKAKQKTRPVDNPRENNIKDNNNENSKVTDELANANNISETDHSNSCPEIFLPKEWSY